MNILPREEAKRRILELMLERADRSRYIVGDKGVLHPAHLELAEILPKEALRHDCS